MSYAPDYTPGTSFADDETNNVAGRSLVKTDSLDAELADISTSINNLNGNLQALQRDDNKLKDGIIEPYAFSEQTNALISTAGCNPRGTWAPNTDYAFKDIVQRNNIAQISLQAHNSGSSFTQSFWLPISGDGTSAANAAAAAASASAASASQTASAASATSASSSASSASTSATNAATSATNALNSASSASTSATNAANSASEAVAAAASITDPLNATNDPTFSSISSLLAVSAEWVKGLLPGFVRSLFNVGGSAPMFACRAWVNFNGGGTPSIRASGNVSSITKNGTGDYTVNFTTAMPDANYSVGLAFGNGSLSGAYSMHAPFGTPTSSGVRIACATVATTPVLIDAGYINAQIFR